MALKSDRYEFQTDISFFMNETATRGGIVCLSTGGSGAAMDQSQALVTYSANPSGKKPMGFLLNDMVNLDLTRQHLNQYKNEVQKGSKVTILRKGYVVTNMIEGTNPAAGDDVYVAHSGNIAKSNIVSQETMTSIGKFLSSKDQDGYAKVEINLP
jgi:antitoxin (DNA-binding transcriptional repressor) of toxin-antitoxin stability system